MAIDQQGLAMERGVRRQGIAKRPVIGAMDLLNAALELGPVDRAAPKPAVAMGSRRDEAKAVAGAGADRCRRNAENGGGIDFLLVAVAIDHRARNGLDDGADACGNRPPGEPVDQRVFQRFEGATPLRRVGQNRLGIMSSRMGHGQKHRQGLPRRVDGGGWIQVHWQ